MHPLYQKANELTHQVIGGAIEVHREKGPGLIESIYEWCMSKELELRGIRHETQQRVPIHYKGFTKEETLRFDLFVDQCLLVEIKVANEVNPIFKAQLLSYLKLLNVPLGLLINFNEMKLIDGVSRLVLQGATP